MSSSPFDFLWLDDQLALNYRTLRANAPGDLSQMSFRTQAPYFQRVLRDGHLPRSATFFQYDTFREPY